VAAQDGETPGLKSMAVGGLVCVIGLAVTIGTASAGGNKFVVAWGAILFGGLQFFWGLVQYMSAPSPAGPPVAMTLDMLPVGPRTLVEIMCSVVHRHEEPSAAELAALRRVIVERLNGVLPDETLKELARTSPKSGAEIVAKLSQRKPDLDRATKDAIITGCFAVMTSDGPRAYVVPVLTEMATAMGMAENQLKELLHERIRAFDGKDISLIISLDPAFARQGGQQRFSFANAVPCAACNGTGCNACGETGRVPGQTTLTMTFPANVKNGDKFRLDDRGGTPVPGGLAGTLFVTAEIVRAAAT
jgi:hypothetical protein